jgi:hypothetical protein
MQQFGWADWMVGVKNEVTTAGCAGLLLGLLLSKLITFSTYENELGREEGSANDAQESRQES